MKSLFLNRQFANSILPIFFSFFLFPSSLVSQSPWANTVHSHQFGGGQTVGQSPNYFPNNVLGAVSPNITATTPANLPEEIVSLGRNGWVALGFEAPIIDGQGADFTVFENAFEIAGGLGIFDEWLIVSVSNDGINWFTFPYDSLTGAGMAGRTPTQGGGVNYLDPSQSGGDSYDIADLGLSQIQYVKVQDATKFQSPDKVSAELDAIIALHQSTTAIEASAHLYNVYVTDNSLYISTEIPLAIEIFSLEGKRLETLQSFPTNSAIFSLENWSKGIYFLKINEKEVIKILLQ